MNQKRTQDLDKISKQLKSQYDIFLHEVQKEKMKELWDNPDDEDWNDA